MTTMVMTPIHRFLAPLLLALALGAGAARAAEVAFPPGSRIGLAPPGGLVTSKNFFGFEDPDNNVAIIMVSLPVEAYADLEKSATADQLKRQGVTLETREALSLSLGRAFLVIGRQEVEKTKIRKWILVAASPALTALVTVQVPDAARTSYPDAAIRAALASLAVRDTVPDEAQLSLLPFKVGELAGFRISGIMPGRAVMLGDGAGGPGQVSERDAFARDAFATIAGLKEVRVTGSEPLRIGGQQGHQIIADAKDASGATALTVVQWLRFGGSAYLQMVGIARAEAWKDAYPRFRSVRDGIDPK